MNEVILTPDEEDPEEGSQEQARRGWCGRDREGHGRGETEHSGECTDLKPLSWYSCAYLPITDIFVAPETLAARPPNSLGGRIWLHI